MKIKLLSENGKIPTRGSAEAAGYDLYAAAPAIILPHTTEKIPTDIAIQIPYGYWGGIYARSGLATKKGLRPANCCGVVDSDYRGPVIVALHNDTENPQTIEPGERIAQLIIQPYIAPNFEVVDELTETERGECGFGSTGTK